MRYFVIASAMLIAAAFATATLADTRGVLSDLTDNSTLQLTATNGQLEFGTTIDLENTDGGIYAGVSGFDHMLSDSIIGNLYGEVAYTDAANSKLTAFTGEYQLAAVLTPSVIGYGAVGGIYTFSDLDALDESGFATTYAGVDLLTDTWINPWVEVGYTWELTDNSRNPGGYGEVGAQFNITDTIAFAPSVIQSFDAAEDGLSGNLQILVAF